MDFSIVPRRTFEDDVAQPSLGDANDRKTASDLREHGLIRVSMILPISVNEEIKTIAKGRNLNADEYLGMRFMEHSWSRVKLEKAEQIKAQLIECLGPDWLSLLQAVNT